MFERFTELLRCCDEPPHSIWQSSDVQMLKYCLNSAQKFSCDEVRGHFKVKKTGVYWWNPFVRGDATKGFVSHDYDASA